MGHGTGSAIVYGDPKFEEKSHREFKEKLLSGTICGISSGIVGGFLGPVAFGVVLGAYVVFESMWDVIDYSSKIEYVPDFYD